MSSSPVNEIFLPHDGDDDLGLDDSDEEILQPSCITQIGRDENASSDDDGSDEDDEPMDEAIGWIPRKMSSFVDASYCEYIERLSYFYLR